MKEYIVYYQAVYTKTIHYVQSYETMKQAVEKITSLYIMDNQSISTRHQYYYFIREMNR